ncbi:papain like protease [Chitinophaga dinghuensis]|uniref:Papain like protease n=1 Tax=Chitinophaga dinghuensis TaxID=1539050 RepID=A0A327VR28_9BACT|nr:C1 family peptidase [Chitinophaga dinghuensis]RAJ77493.1 papain like protease [Chitinophaga dinghuensis]
MKSLLLAVAVAIGFQTSFAQSSSLREYCPFELAQVNATCASYATVYSALSTQYNAANGFHASDSGFTAFSYGYIASRMKADKRGLRRIFNRCGLNVGADIALETLKKYGTFRMKEFPYICACTKLPGVESNYPSFKINNFTCLGTDSSIAVEHIEKIKGAIDQKLPVVAAIYQTPFFHANRVADAVFPEHYEKVETKANHVVCILGYDEHRNGGSFLIKNNYADWGGDHGFGYVKYSDMLKLIRATYVISL